MKIKKTPAAFGLMALVAISTVGLSSATLAAGRNHFSNNASATSTAMRLEKGNRWELTETQKLEIEKNEQLKRLLLKPMIIMLG